MQKNLIVQERQKQYWHTSMWDMRYFIQNISYRLIIFLIWRYARYLAIPLWTGYTNIGVSSSNQVNKTLLRLGGIIYSSPILRKMIYLSCTCPGRWSSSACGSDKPPVSARTRWRMCARRMRTRGPGTARTAPRNGRWARAPRPAGTPAGRGTVAYRRGLEQNNFSLEAIHFNWWYSKV